MFDKIKKFYGDHKDQIVAGAFIALGGVAVTGAIALGRSNKKIVDLQKFHDDVYDALKSGFTMVLDTENENGDYMVRLVDPATDAIGAVTEAVTDVAVAAIEASSGNGKKK